MMHIQANDLIAGLKAKALRDYFRRLAGRSFVIQDIVAELGVAPDEAAHVEERLLSEGLVVQEAHPNPSDDRRWFELSTRGNALAQASFTKRFSRKRANELMRETVSRAAEINSNDDLTHRIVELRVFGSYLTDTEDLGDLDIAYALEFRHPGKSPVELSQERARLSGKSRLSFFETLTFGESEVLRLLRGKNSRISLHDMDELKQLEVEGLIVFPADFAKG